MGGLLRPLDFVRGFLLPERLFGAVRARSFGRYCALVCAAMGVSLALEMYVLRDSGRVSDVISLFFRAAGRHAGAPRPGAVVARSTGSS